MGNKHVKAGLTLVSITVALPAYASEISESAAIEGPIYEEVRIIGTPENAADMAGSAFVVTDVELEKFSYGDIHSVLQSVPGVYILQEEGYGLRPNIGIRGASSSRSEQVTLMEDGVLIAPAPYSAPSAYYTPTFSRMSGLEVLKGPETIQYGPATVGGAVNMISTPIPQQASGRLAVDLGEYAEQRMHVWYGDSSANFGWLLETTQYGADGYKDIDRSSNDTGFDIEDYMVKLRLNSDPGEIYHQFDLKLQHSSEISEQSYMGLTYSDFKADPNRQYGLTSEDEMDNEHTGVNATYLLKWNEMLTFSATAYFNNFKRDWFKINDGIGNFSQAQLDGIANAVGVEIKHNNREYDSYGIQTKLNIEFEALGSNHDLDIGLRIHEDETDRFQPIELWDQDAGQLVYRSTVAPNEPNNRIEEAEALSFYVMDHIKVNDKLDITAGIRYEDVETKQTRYATPDRSSGSVANENNFDDVILGLGATYQLTESWQLLAGVHEGFAVPNAGSTDTEPASGINYEYGVRYQRARLKAEFIGFFTENENTIQNCSLVNPCGAQTSGSTSLGESEINGIELVAQYDFASPSSALQLPLRVSYTYTDGEITDPKNNPDTEKGDPLLDVPENQLSVQFGMAHEKGWDIYLNGSYTDTMCADFDCNIATGTETQELVVWDLAGGYQITEDLRLNARVDNVLDRQEIVSWKPDGARPNKPRTAYVGLVYDF